MMEEPIVDKISVLFIDDEENVIRSLRRLFRKRDDWDCLFATRPSEAVKIIAEREIAVVVCDHKMPEMSGAHLLAKLRDKRPNMVSIMLTGQASTEDVEVAINDGGIFKFLQKPWDDQELAETIEGAIRKHQQKKNLQSELIEHERQVQSLEDHSKELRRTVEDRTNQLHDALYTAQSMRSDSFSTIFGICDVFFGLLEIAQPLWAAHAKRVQEISSDIAEKLQFSSERLLLIEAAARFHDIGKIGLPSYLFEKNTSEFSDNERAIYEQHPTLGWESLHKSPELRDLADIVRSHHERLDGKGFPDRKHGSSIPLEASIILAADMIASQLEKHRGNPSLALQLVESALKDGSGKLFPGNVATAAERAAAELRPKLLNRAVESIRIQDLAPKMVLAESLYTSTGTLLAAADTELTARSIARIRSVAKVDWVTESVLVAAAQKSQTPPRQSVTF